MTTVMTESVQGAPRMLSAGESLYKVLIEDQRRFDLELSRYVTALRVRIDYTAQHIVPGRTVAVATAGDMTLMITTRIAPVGTAGEEFVPTCIVLRQVTANTSVDVVLVEGPEHSGAFKAQDEPTSSERKEQILELLEQAVSRFITCERRPYFMLAPASAING